jgi:tetratricopeptide (TPR) repeat protein
MVSLVSPGLIGAAGSPAPQFQSRAAQKKWKDRHEYDLYNSITRTADAQEKLDLLDDWTKKYPNTDFKSERATLYVTTNVALGHAKDAVAAARQLLGLDASDFTGLYYMTMLTLQAADVSPGALDESEKAANGLLAALDEKFAAANKPATASDAEWANARSVVEAIAHTTLGWVAMQRKDNTKAEQEFTKSLQLNPANGQASYWLGTVILAEKDPSKQALALYDFARAAAYDGPGALAPAGRQSVRQYLDKVYTIYHGSTEGLENVLAATGASALPPDGFNIKVAADVGSEESSKNTLAATKASALPPEERQPATGWAVVKSWSGGGTKETELFSVSGGEWRIAWECRSVASPGSGIFQIEVKNGAGRLVSVAANQQGAGADVSYVHAPAGEYYLTINSANVNWRVRVEVRP